MLSDHNKEIRKKMSPKKVLKIFFRDFFILIIAFLPFFGYLGTSYYFQLQAPQDKAPYVYWCGIDPKNAVFVSWETANEKESIIQYGTNPNNLDQIITNSTKATFHKIELTGLSPNTKYYYQVFDEKENKIGPLGRFVTAPSEWTSFNITLISDTQQFMGTGHYNTIAKSIANHGDTSFLIDAGDLGQEPDDQDTWNLFWEYTNEYSNFIPLAPVPGNHDGSDTHNLYTHYFGNTTDTGRYYAFNWSNTQFVMAEIADMGDRDYDVPENKIHFQWLENTLQAGMNQMHRILVFHRNVFSSFGNDQTIMDRILPLVSKYNVSLVFYGHMHSYERFWYNGTNFVCLGGGGGLQNSYIYTQPTSQIHAMGASFTQLFITNSNIKLITYSPTYDVIDEVTFNPIDGRMTPNWITTQGGTQK